MAQELMLMANVRGALQEEVPGKGRTAAGLGQLELALLYQLLQAPLPARKPARDPRCTAHAVRVSHR